MTTEGAREVLATIMARDGLENQAAEIRAGHWDHTGYIEAMLAFAARPTAGIDRTTIAQIIDPVAFKNWQGLYDYCIGQGDDEASARRYAFATHKPECDAALEKADAILALAATGAKTAPVATPAKTGERGAWRPISTAPKDGSRILGATYCDLAGASGWRFAVMFWDVEFQADGWDEAKDAINWRAGWNAWRVGDWDSETYFEEVPTHWRPLPDAPIVSGEGA